MSASREQKVRMVRLFLVPSSGASPVVEIECEHDECMDHISRLVGGSCKQLEVPERDDGVRRSKRGSRLTLYVNDACSAQRQLPQNEHMLAHAKHLGPVAGCLIITRMSAKTNREVGMAANEQPEDWVSIILKK